MSDLVKRICAEWIADGRSDDCFWEGWPECPTPEDSLTPKMVMGRIEELEAENARLTGCLKRANENTAHFEREWYLAKDRAEAAEVKLATAVEALEDMANQKRTDELETEYDVECADFEGGYDACIDVARAAIRAMKSTSQT